MVVEKILSQNQRQAIWKQRIHSQHRNLGALARRAAFGGRSDAALNLDEPIENPGILNVQPQGRKRIINRGNDISDTGRNCMEKKELVAKVCLYGEVAVGKTSLIRRFVFDQYDDKYLATIGTKVSKKVVSIRVPRKKLKVNLTMMVWDIMGQIWFRKLIEEAYFYGADAMIGVCDITRKQTLTDLRMWKRPVFKSGRRVATMIFVNKYDLREQAEISEKDIKPIASALKASYVYTSAKTGENVEKGFCALAETIVARKLQAPC